MSDVLRTLEDIVGPDRVSASKSVCRCYQFNCFMGKEWLVTPDVVVLAGNTDEVSRIVKAANRHRVPVTVKGAAGGGGLGGALRAGILLDLSLMESVVSLDVENMKVVAEAGCSFFKLAQELFKNGLMLPIGGYGCGPNVAASAIDPSIGFGKTKYGPNIDLVEGFEVVLPTGEVCRVGSMAYADKEFGPYYRYITGPDLVGLFTRSNGALGIVTKVAFHCLRKPLHWAFHAYYWPLSSGLGNVTRALMEATAMEVFDIHLNDKARFVLEGVSEFPDGCHFIVMVTVNAGDREELKIRERLVERMTATHGGTYLPGLVEDHYIHWPTRSAGWARRRKDAPPSAVTGRPYMSIMDELIYPTSWLPEVYSRIMATCTKHGLCDNSSTPIFDGYPMKRHVMSSQTWVPTDIGDPCMVERYRECRADFREWFGRKGGTFQMKLPPLVPGYSWTNQEGAFDLVRSIKKALDPNDILSPGTFEPAESMG